MNENTYRSEIRCPECGSEDYDCYDISTMDGIHWDFCCCEDCGAEFDVKYIAVEIKLK